MSHRALGVFLALASAGCFQLAYVLLTEQARDLETAVRPDASYLGRLVRRPAYLAAMTLNGAAFGLELLALRQVSLVVVQPLLAFGLVVLVLVDRAVLGEAVGRRQVLGAVLVAGGVTLVILGAPDGSSRLPVDALSVACVVVLLAALLAPQIEHAGSAWRLVVAAGAGDTLVALGTNEIAGSFPRDLALVVPCVALVALAGIAGSTSESAALQRLPVFRVAPVVTSTQTTLPVLLVAFLAHERWHSARGHGGLLAIGVGVIVGGVACLAGTELSSDRSATPVSASPAPDR